MRRFYSLWILLAFSCAANGQEDQIYLEIKKSQTLGQVLETINNKYHLVFSYSDRLAEEVKIAPGRWKANSTEDLLSDFCHQNNLEYRISDQGDILLRPALQPKTLSSIPDQWYISGRVIDQDEQGIPDVAVYIDTLNIGGFSDEDGFFHFKIPYKHRDRKLIFQSLGFELEKMGLSELDSREEVQLKPISLNLKPITVTEHIPRLQQLQADGSTRWVDADVLLPGGSLTNDIFRTIQLMPGVSAHDDLSAAIKIRGSGSDETLLVLDGIPIYKAEHFFGIFSALNSNYIQEATLYKNALPASFGGKTGGMLLMKSNGDLYNRMGVDLDVNLLTSSAVLRVPLGDQLALNWSGRTTYKNAASTPLFASLDAQNQGGQLGTTVFTRPDLFSTLPTFQFYDMHARLVYQLNNQSRLDLNYYQSQDDFSNEYENNFKVRVGQNRFANNVERYSNLEAWSNQGMSLNYQLSLSRHLDLKANLYYSTYANDGFLASSLSRRLPGEEIDLKSFENFQNNKIQGKGAKIQLNRSLEHFRRVEAGIEIINHQNFVELGEEDVVLLQSNAQAYETALFTSLPVLNYKNLYLELGNRLTYYSGSDQLYWSPRLKMQYNWHRNGYLKSAFTRSNQFVRELIYNNRLGQSMAFFTLGDEHKFPVGHSNNYMLGTNWQFGPWSLDLELYQKKYWGLMEFGRIFPGFDPIEVNPGRFREYGIFEGEGQTRGLDFMLSLDQENYQSWLSYTLSKTTHEFEAIYQGASFPSEDDRRHQLSWVNNYQWSAFEFSASYVMASGRPFLNLARLQNPRDLRALSPDQLFDRLPAYHRLDLGISYSFTWSWLDCALGLSVFNVTNRQNVKYQQFVYSVPFQKADNGAPKNLNQVIGTTTGMLDRTLNVSFRAQF